MTGHTVDPLRFFPPGTPVVALPSWSVPRLVIAAGHPGRRWEHSRLFPAFRLSARFRKFALRCRSLLSCARRVPPGPWLSGPLLEKSGLGDAQILAVLQGYAGSASKIVVWCADRRGEYYLKFGRHGSVQQRILREHQILGRLQGLPVPRPLACMEYDGLLGLLMTACPGSPLPGAVLPAAAMLRLERRLRSGGRMVSGEHPWLVRLRAQVPAAVGVTSILEGEHLVCPRHGDFAPWNVLSGKNGTFAVDWEHGTLDGYPGADLAFAMLQCGFLLRGLEPAPALEAAARWLFRHGRCASRIQARALVALVALDAWLQCREDGLPAHTPLQQWRQAVWRQA